LSRSYICLQLCTIKNQNREVDSTFLEDNVNCNLFGLVGHIDPKLDRQVTVKRHGFILLSHLKVLSLLDLVFNINWQIRAIVALEAREEHVQRGCIKLDGATFWDYT